MKTKTASFTIKPFKNRNGAISYRVAGWLLGERIRKNFKSREDAILERDTLQLKQAQAGNSETIIRRHYLNVTTPQEAETFFEIMPKRHEAPEANNATVSAAAHSEAQQFAA